jgi:hypothetical protein
MTTQDATEDSASTTLPFVTHVFISDVDVGPWVKHLKIQTQIHESSRSTFVLQFDATRLASIDYFAPVRVVITYNGVDYPRFAGVVEFVTVLADGVEIQCEGMPLLRERLTYTFARENVSASEVIWTLGRMAGYPETKLLIEGIETLKPEPIEVVVPVFNVKPDPDLHAGAVRLTDLASVGWATAGWGDEHAPAVAQFESALSYALVRVNEALLYQAETLAIKYAETAVAWLNARLRYGHARLPDGVLQQFDRTTAVVQPLIGKLVAVRGLTSGRRWLRVSFLGTKRAGAILPVSALEPFAPPIGETMPSSEAEALLAYSRSLNAHDPLAAVITLWDAVNYYAAGARVTRLFSREEIDEIKASIPTSLDPAKRNVVMRKLQTLNDPPLMERLKVAMERDGIHLTDGEFAVLQRLRKVRNPAQHGNVPPVVDPYDLAQGWSIVARMLLHRSTATRRDQDAE